MESAQSLDCMLANRRWLRRSIPFPHFVAKGVFVQHVYRRLEAAFREMLSRGFGTDSDMGQSMYAMKGYDAYAFNFRPGLTGPFSLFISRPWHEMLASLVGVNATGEIDGALHHHRIGAVSGHVHNDLNPGWFVKVHSIEGITVSDACICSYNWGETYRPGLVARESIRAVAMIFYLNNRPWFPGDGGETGLYRSEKDPVDRPAAVVPPVNNSILVFECTPHSYHSFIRSKRRARNSVIMWLHRPKKEVVLRWGEKSIVKWRRE